MKRFFIRIIFLSLIIFQTVLYGQPQFSFRVLANKGHNSVKNATNENDWFPLKTGAKLYKGDEIMVSNNGYLGLVHTSGKTIEIKASGKVSVNDLIAKMGGSNPSLAGKYADVAFSHLTNENKGTNKYANFVDRSTTPIHLIGPSSTFIHSNMAIIKWVGPANSKEFIVTVKNLFETAIITEQINQPTYTVDLNDPKLKKENLLIISVSAKNDSKLYSNEIGIKRLPEEDLKTLNKDFNLLTAETGEETPLNKIIVATFYEQHNLLLDAINSYEGAIRLAPEVEDFRTAYDLFLSRNNLRN